jgi:hypothetical protein
VRALVFRHSLAREAASAIGGRVDRRAGASPLVPWSGRAWLQDGPGVVYDTIGSV